MNIDFKFTSRNAIIIIINTCTKVSLLKGLDELKELKNKESLKLFFFFYNNNN